MISRTNKNCERFTGSVQNKFKIIPRNEKKKKKLIEENEKKVFSQTYILHDKAGVVNLPLLASYSNA